MKLWYESQYISNTLLVKEFIPGVTNLNDKNGFLPISGYPSGACDFLATNDKEKEKEKNGDESTKKKENESEKREENWYYRDPMGNEHGPWPFEQIQTWAKKGYIPILTPFRNENQSLFQPFLNVKFAFIDKKTEDKLIKEARDRDMDGSRWVYLDDNQQVQGPFGKKVLRHWYRRQWMPLDIPVKRIDETEWSTMDVRKAEILSDKEFEPIRRSFQSSLTTDHSTNDHKWFYLDFEKGHEQGPFTTEIMRQWFLMNYFPPFTKVRRSDGKEFIALKDWIPPPEFALALPGQLQEFNRRMLASTSRNTDIYSDAFGNNLKPNH